MKPETKLVQLIAKVPAGEKLPIAAIARILDASQAVVVSMIHGLIEQGKLDKDSVRPVAERQDIPAAAGPGKGRRADDMPAADIVAEIDAFIATGAMTKSVFAKQCLKSPTALPRLRKQGATIRPSTAERIRAFIRNHSPDAVATPAASDSDAGAAERAKPFAPAPSDQPTGAELVSEIRGLARRRGVSAARLAGELSPHPQTFLSQLEQARRPKALTIARVRALIDGLPIPPVPPRTPSVTCTRQERAERGLPPSKREIRDNRSLELRAEERAKLALLRDVAETRHDQHEKRLREVVQREAEETVSRRAAASRLTTRHPLAIGRDDDDEDDCGEILASRREREFADVATPSALIRRATAEWPEKCAAVKALAAEIGISLAEAWQRVIAAGIDCLSDPEAA